VRLIPRRDPKREPLIRPEDILLSKRITWRIDDPFTIFECRDFLPPHIAQQLQREFPWSELDRRMQPGSYRAQIDEKAASDLFSQVLTARPYTAAVLRAMKSQAFRRDFRRLFRVQITARARRGSLRSWLFFRFLPISLMDVKSDFTLYRRGFQLTPHIDASKKLLALLLYFEDPRASTQERLDAQSVGGTGYWRGRRPDVRHKWFTRLTGQVGVDPETKPAGSLALARRYGEADPESGDFTEFAIDFERFVHVPPCENTLAGFVKSRDSWHDVDLRNYPHGVRRGAILININLVIPTLARLVAPLRGRRN
jgi:hypothetical protein